MRSDVLPSGRLNISTHLRRELINNGPEYTPKIMGNAPYDDSGLKPPRRVVHIIKNEFEFGMSKEARKSFFKLIEMDILNGNATGHHVTNEFTNAEAIAALRKQAVRWSENQNNKISTIEPNDKNIKEFLRELVRDIPESNRHAALALIDQPAGYRRPLPGTIAAQLANFQTSRGDVLRTAANQAPPVIQAQQDIQSPNAKASAFAASFPVSSAVGKRSHAEVDPESTLYGNQLPTSKRSRPDYEAQEFPLSASDNPQPSSSSSTPNGVGESNQSHFIQRESVDPSQQWQPPQPSQSSSWSASNGMTRSDVQQQMQPQMQPSDDLATTTYQPHLFQGNSFDPSQTQTPSSWSASNGMSQMTSQQQPQRQMPQTYNSGNANYQTDVFHAERSFDSTQLQTMHYMQGPNTWGPEPWPSSYSWSTRNGMGQTDAQYNQHQYQYQQHQHQMQPAYNMGAANYQQYMPQSQPFHPSQSQSQSQSQPMSSWAALNGTGQSMFQQQQQPPIPQVYSLWNNNRQPNMFQGEQYFDQSQFQPQFQPQFQSPFHTQVRNNSEIQNYQNPQFNQVNSFQGPHTTGSSPMGQPNYGSSSAPASSNPATAPDDEWTKFLQTIDDVKPMVPAAYTQLTPILPLAIANNQPTSESATVVLPQKF